MGEKTADAKVRVTKTPGGEPVAEIIGACPECGARRRVPANYAGRPFPCPKCKQTVILRTGKQANADPATRPQPSAPSVKTGWLPQTRGAWIAVAVAVVLALNLGLAIGGAVGWVRGLARGRSEINAAWRKEGSSRIDYIADGVSATEGYLVQDDILRIGYTYRITGEIKLLPFGGEGIQRLSPMEGLAAMSGSELDAGEEGLPIKVLAVETLIDSNIGEVWYFVAISGEGHGNGVSRLCGGGACTFGWFSNSMLNRDRNKIEKYKYHIFDKNTEKVGKQLHDEMTLYTLMKWVERMEKEKQP